MELIERKASQKKRVYASDIIAESVYKVKQPQVLSGSQKFVQKLLITYEDLKRVEKERNEDGNRSESPIVIPPQLFETSKAFVRTTNGIFNRKGPRLQVSQNFEAGAAQTLRPILPFLRSHI